MSASRRLTPGSASLSARRRVASARSNSSWMNCSWSTPQVYSQYRRVPTTIVQPTPAAVVRHRRAPSVRTHLAPLGMHSGAARARFGALSRFYDWLLDDERIPANPHQLLGRASRPKAPAARGDYLRPDRLARRSIRCARFLPVPDRRSVPPWRGHQPGLATPRPGGDHPVAAGEADQERRAAPAAPASAGARTRVAKRPVGPTPGWCSRRRAATA
jgi:hypothetical protein